MKKCPYCQQEIQDEAVKCRYCAEMLIRGVTPPIDVASLNFPNLLPGYVFAAILLMLRMGLLAMPVLELKAVLGLVAGVLALGGYIYWFICIYKLHKILLNISGHCYPISPGMAVGLGFVPLYNFYWMFKWPGEIIHFVRVRSDIKTWGAWVPGMLLLFAVVAPWIFGGLGFLLQFGALSYLVHILKESLSLSAEPIPYKSKLPGSVAATVVICVCIIPVIGLLAAIAIPNFLRARANANDEATRMMLKTLSVELEQSAAKNGTVNPLSDKRGILSGAQVIRGYRYSSKPVAGGYEIVAVPESCYSTGTKNFKMTQNGVISEERCILAASSKK